MLPRCPLSAARFAAAAVHWRRGADACPSRTIAPGRLQELRKRERGVRGRIQLRLISFLQDYETFIDSLYEIGSDTAAWRGRRGAPRGRGSQGCQFSDLGGRNVGVGGCLPGGQGPSGEPLQVP
jgi:hypothetical protein